MATLHLVADDLTGALDTAAQFAFGGRSVPVYFSGGVPGDGSGDFAVDLGTREGARAPAEEAARAAAHLLKPGADVLPFRKVDSLVRGHPWAELAATLEAIQPARCVIAPAFPHHGRVTRGGRTLIFRRGGWEPVGEPIHAALRAHGIDATLVRPGDPVPGGASVWDAESEGDLRRIVDGVRASGEPVLWCGSAGLAGALAGGTPAVFRCRRPLLGIFGSDHGATAAQLAACGEHVVRVRDGGSDAGAVEARLGDTGFCLTAVQLPQGIGRAEAAARIAREVAGLVGALPTPASAVVSGGETLRSLCDSVGADHLRVMGQIAPGVPVSAVVGGRWDGVVIASKSGSFGDDGFLDRHFVAGTA